ncbi:MAG: EAL domain-containing protein [Acetobacteraceae bacterium]|nr:EAL domain-containing protein [Acetobacteraceae bacterium]
MIDQVRSRGLNVVAAGVETQETRDRLSALGAREAQGFFIARLLPAAAVPVWLNAWRGASA